MAGDLADRGGSGAVSALSPSWLTAWVGTALGVAVALLSAGQPSTTKAACASNTNAVKTSTTATDGPGLPA